MNDKPKQLLSARAYSRLRNVSHVYISRLVKRGAIPTHGPKRLLDPAEADRARQENTVVARRQRATAFGDPRKLDPAILARLCEWAVCQACGWKYHVFDAYEAESPEPRRYCTDSCANDIASGMTPAQVRAQHGPDVEELEDLPVPPPLQ